jgi:hypothetical protein
MLLRTATIDLPTPPGDDICALSIHPAMVPIRLVMAYLDGTPEKRGTVAGELA